MRSDFAESVCGVGLRSRFAESVCGVGFAECGLRIAGCGCGLRIAGSVCGLRIAGCGLRGEVCGMLSHFYKLKDKAALCIREKLRSTITQPPGEPEEAPDC